MTYGSEKQKKMQINKAVKTKDFEENISWNMHREKAIKVTRCFMFR